MVSLCADVVRGWDPGNRRGKRIMKRMAWLVGLLLCGTGPGRCGTAEAHVAVVESWLAAATNLVTWEAAFTQTRHLAALKQPLVSTG